MVVFSIKNGNQDGFLYEGSVQDTNDELISKLVSGLVSPWCAVLSPRHVVCSHILFYFSPNSLAPPLLRGVRWKSGTCGSGLACSRRLFVSWRSSAR